MAEAQRFQLSQLFLRRALVDHALAAVDFLHDGLDLFLQGQFVAIGETEVVRLFLNDADHFPGQFFAALAAVGPHVGQGHVHAVFLAGVGDHLQLGVGIGIELVDGHHGGQAVNLGDVFHMLEQVRQALFQRLQVLLVQVGLGHAAVMLQGAHRGHDDAGVGFQACQTALDVQELLGTQVGAEASLGDHIVAEFQGCGGGLHAVAAVGDVGEGAAVDDGGGAFQGLDQVGLDGILEQGRHGALGLQIMGSDRLIVVGIAHDDPAQAGLQIHQVRGQAENGHDFGGNGDVEAVLPRHTLHPAAQAIHDIAQLAVVHIHAALPCDLLDIDPQGVALLDVVVEHGGQQIVGCADSVKIAGEVEVDILHGHHLGVAAAGRAALDAEHRTQRGLPQGQHGVFADLAQAVRQADAGGGLTLAGRRGVDGGNQDQLALHGAVFQRRDVKLGLVLAVILQQVLLDAGGSRHFADGLHFALLGDLDVAFIRCHGQSAPFLKNKKGHTKTGVPRRSAMRCYTPCGLPTSVSHIAYSK